jgi:spore germination protein KB
MENGYKISPRQLIFLCTLYFFGSSVVIGINVNSDVGQDAWISLILSFVFNIPLAIILGRVITIFPGKNIYQIFEELFGKIIAKILILFFIINCLLLGSLVLRDFTEYIEITTLAESPLLPVMICLILVSFYLGRSGMKVLGRWSPIAAAILITTVTGTIIMGLPVFKIDYLKPVLEHSPGQMIKSAFGVFMLPFSELIVILGLADQINIKGREKRTLLYGMVLAAMIFLVILIRNIAILGAPLLKCSLFTSYEAARILSIGDFLTRLEGLITINFILYGITKLAVFVVVLSKGISHLTENKDYRLFAIPSTLMILGICPFLCSDVIDMFDFVKEYGVVSIPFQCVLPIVIWVTAEIKNYKQKKLVLVTQ